MNYIKKFEAFHRSGIDDGASQNYPNYNPILNHKVKDFVDDLVTKGRFEDLASLIGEEFPKELSSDEMEDYQNSLEKKAIKFLIRNPELIEKEIDYQPYKVNGGDGIPRTNNVGGVWGQRR